MSKLDPAGGSLENILASIRRSLSEQSTDALTEKEAAAVPAEAANGEEAQKAARPASRREGLTQRLAGTTPQADTAGSEDDLADLVEEPAAAKSPGSDQPGAAAPAPERAEGDPLWFLTRRAEAAEAKAGGSAAAGGAEPAKLTRPEELRASLPPFFGSGAEAAKAEAAPVEPVPPAVGATRVPVRTAAQAAAPPQTQAAGAGLRNGKANSLFGPASDAMAASPGEAPHIHALEAVVVDMLRPMLRQWLDENMPRLVSAALADEAARAGARDPKKA